MTINSTINKVQQNGNGVTTAFPFGYYYTAPGDLVVKTTDLSVTPNVDTLLVLGTDYTIAGNASIGVAGFSSATINMTVAPPSTKRVTIQRIVALVQGISYPETGPFPAKTHEGALDYLTIITQQLSEQYSRSLQYPATDAAGATGVMPNASTRANLFLGFDVNGNPVAAAGTTTISFVGAPTGSVPFAGVAGVPTYDVNNFYWNAVSHILSVNTGGDTTGTDAINTYYQHDSYLPNSAVGALTGAAFSGISASTSRGTGLVPLINQANDLIGGVGCYAYSGASPAYNTHAAAVGRVIGVTTNNLGGQYEIWAKADGGILTLAATFTSTGLNNSVIGATTPLAGTFTTLNATTTPTTNFASTAVPNMIALMNSDEGGFKNVFRNGCHFVNQRGTSGTMTAGTSAYTSDAFIVGCTGANTAWAIGTGAGTDGAHGYYLNLTGNTGMTDTFVRTRIEGSIASKLASQQATFQITLFNNTGAAITPTLTVKYANSVDNFGATTAIITSQALQSAANGTWQTLCYTFAAGNNPANGLEVTVDFGTVINTNAKNVGIAAWDLRATPGITTGLNSNPPQFEFRPIGVEMIICKRYYQLLGSELGSLTCWAYATAAGNTGQTLTWHEMRTQPTATIVGTWVATNCAQPLFNVAGKCSGSLYTTITATGTSVFANNNAGNCITLSAEL